jgi:tryptophan synthase alpha chain
MNAIDALFQRLRDRNAKAFIPFVTAGDPDVATSAALVREMVRRGAHLVEIGFPYSDPIADGSVIQASYTRALDRGLHLADVFTLVRGLADVAVPLVGMVSYSLVFHRGPARFLDESKAAGLSGVIVPDLPVEEADDLARLAAARDLKLIQLVTPTTPRERASRIVRQSTGFLYVVSVAGITGERDRLPPQLLDQLRWLRGQTALPLCVGFGISKPEHVLMLREAVDGVIVGSTLVRRLEEAGKRPAGAIVAEIGDLAAALLAALAG